MSMAIVALLWRAPLLRNLFSKMPRDDPIVEEERRARTATDLIRMRLERLQQNINKPAPLPSRREEVKAPRPPPEFVRNVVGSSAAAGSAEYHIYRINRRKEQNRLDYIAKIADKEELDEQYRKHKEQIEREEAERTAKRRAKRQRRKEAAKRKKRVKKEEEGSSDEYSEESEEEKETSLPEENGGIFPWHDQKVIAIVPRTSIPPDMIKNCMIPPESEQIKVETTEYKALKEAVSPEQTIDAKTDEESSR